MTKRDETRQLGQVGRGKGKTKTFIVNQQQTGTQVGGHIGRQARGQTARQTDRRVGGQAGRRTDGQAGQANRRTGWRTDM